MKHVPLSAARSCGRRSHRLRQQGQAAADPTPSASHSASDGDRAGSGPGPGSSLADPSDTPSSSPKAADVTLDPCQLVTQQEASDMAHTSFGPGKEEGTNVRHTCVYGAQTPNVLMVFVLQGATTGDAQAEWNQLLAQAKSAAGQAANLVHLTPDSSIGDRAEWVELDLSADRRRRAGAGVPPGPRRRLHDRRGAGRFGAQPGRDDRPGADRAEPPVLRRGVAGLGHGRGTMAP